MAPSFVVADGDRRSQAIARLQVLESVPPEGFHRLLRLAAHVAGGESTTINAALHLLDDQQQHRIAAVGGAPLESTPVANSLCVKTIALDRPVFSMDAADDERLVGTTWTTGDDPLRLYIGIPLRLATGAVVGTLCLFDTRRHTISPAQCDLLLDVADEVAAQLDLLALSRELGHDATHDPLTGLANRVLLSERLTLAMSRRARPLGAPTLLLLDLDCFKAVNDVHGHAVGDQVLAGTARRLSALIRPEDLLARLGGDEFAVLIDDGIDEAAAAGLVERLLAAAREPHETPAGPVVCGFSVGIARAGEGELGYELLGRADADLYARKRS